MNKILQYNGNIIAIWLQYYFIKINKIKIIVLPIIAIVLFLYCLTINCEF